MRFEIDTMDGIKTRCHRYDVTGVQHAAAGHQLCAIVASAAEVVYVHFVTSNSCLAD